MTNANRVVFHIVAPLWPEPEDQRLPPILRSPHPASVPGYSEGAWGLSVLLREGGIFTATSISPSLRLRQRPSRYAVHARRNLPDKELRSDMLVAQHSPPRIHPSIRTHRSKLKADFSGNS